MTRLYRNMSERITEADARRKYMVPQLVNRAQRAEQALAERDAEIVRYRHALRNILTPSMQRAPEYAGMTLGDIAYDALGDNDAVKTGDEK